MGLWAAFLEVFFFFFDEELVLSLAAEDTARCALVLLGTIVPGSNSLSDLAPVCLMRL